MKNLNELDQEIEYQASHMMNEIINRLINKWEQDIEKISISNQDDMFRSRNEYVNLKISLQRLKRYYNDLYCPLVEDSNNKTIFRLNNLTKEARRKYYVAKRRYEGEHHEQCSCRGCRVIKAVQSSS